MKIPHLMLILLASARVVAADDTNATSSSVLSNMQVPNRESFEGTVLKVYTAKDGNAGFKAYAVMWKGQEIIVADQFAESDFKEGDVIKFLMFKVPAHGRRKTDFLNFQVMPPPVLPVVAPQIRVVPNAAHTAYFECRGNQLFYIDKDGLEAQATVALADKPPAGAQSPSEPLVTPISNANYIADPAFLSMSMLRLRLRSGAQGEGVGDLDRPDSEFQKTLQKLNRTEVSIVFMVRDDSEPVYEKARQIAEAAGFQTSLHNVAAGSPIMFAIDPGIAHSRPTQ
jgi:hypothetical protein